MKITMYIDLPDSHCPPMDAAGRVMLFANSIPCGLACEGYTRYSFVIELPVKLPTVAQALPQALPARAEVVTHETVGDEHDH